MAAAVIADATKPDVRRDPNAPTVPPALRMAARSFRSLSGVDVGGAPLLTLEPWPGDVSGDGPRIRAEHAGAGQGMAVEFELPVER